MSPAPLPPYEADRLATLRGLDLLDTPGEDAFDDLTRLAAHVCGTPIALISLVDCDRQWFKSAYGLDLRETARDVAFCAHAILTPGHPTVVEDARNDSRFTHNPLVTGAPHVRAYAGVPLVWSDNQPIGTLCVMDRVPRSLSTAQLDALACIARQVLSQIALRQAAHVAEAKLHEAQQARVELERSERHYRELTENAQGLICYHSLDGTLRMVNGAACRALGASREQLLGTNLREFVPPEYYEGYERYLQLASQNGHFQGLLTLQGKGGRRIALAYQNFVFDGDDGPLVMAHGIDISDRVRIEGVNRRMARVLDSSPDFVAFFDKDGEPTYMNRAARAMCGLAKDAAVLGVGLADLLGEEAAPRFREAMERARAAGGSSHDETDIPHRDGTRTPVSQLTLAQVNIHGGVEFYAVIARDISERLRGEQSMQATEQRFRRVVESLQEVLFETDGAGTWTYLNPAWREITGYSVDETIGRPVVEFVLPEDRELHEKRFRALLHHEKDATRYEVRYQMRNGGLRWIEVHARATNEGGALGSPSDYWSVCDDIPKQQLQLRARGRLAGSLSYQLRGRLLALEHTNVFPEFQGQGAARRLAENIASLRLTSTRDG